MNPYIIPGLPNHVTRDIIFQRVCDFFKKDPEEVRKKDKKRDREYVEIRQITMTLIKWKIEKISWENTANYFDKDHATAIHAAKTVLDLWDTDRMFREKVSELFGGERPEIEFRDYIDVPAKRIY